MFESAEMRHEIDKATYEEAVPKLREELLDAQYDLLERKDFPVLVIIAGHEFAGKSETVQTLNEWMDPATRPHPRLPAAHRRGGRAPADVPLLAGTAAEGHDRDLLRLLVHGAAREPGLRPDRRRRARPLDQPHPPPRAHAPQRGRAGPQVLHARLEARAAQAAQGAREGPRHALAGIQGAQDAGGEVRRAERGGGDDDPRDQHRRGPLGCRRRLRPPLPHADRRADPRRGDTPAARPAGSRRGGDGRPGRPAGRQRPAGAGTGPVAAAREGRLPQAARGVPAAFRPADAIQGLRQALAGPGLRRLGCGGQGRDDPPRHGGAGRARVPDRAGGGPHRGGARPALPVAVLAAHAGTPGHRDLRPHVVRARAGRARRGLLRRGRLDARLRRDQRVRGAARRRRRASSASSGCRSARTSSCAASRRARRSASSASRSPRRTGATATSGRPTSRRWPTWSTVPRPASPHGRWSRPTTSTSRG